MICVEGEHTVEDEGEQVDDFTVKVPKHENFSLAFFALREPIWVGNLETDPKNPFFII
jgi:hypothetical protein